MIRAAVISGRRRRFVIEMPAAATRHEPLHALREADRHLGGHEAAHRVADHDARAEVELLAERVDLARVARDRDLLRRHLGVAEARQVHARCSGASARSTAGSRASSASCRTGRGRTRSARPRRRRGRRSSSARPRSRRSAGARASRSRASRAAPWRRSPRPRGRAALAEGGLRLRRADRRFHHARTVPGDVPDRTRHRLDPARLLAAVQADRARAPRRRPALRGAARVGDDAAPARRRRRLHRGDPFEREHPRRRAVPGRSRDRQRLARGGHWIHITSPPPHVRARGDGGAGSSGSGCPTTTSTARSTR